MEFLQQNDARFPRKESVLEGKKILFCGDSICAASVYDYKDCTFWGWAGRIASATGAKYINLGRDGASLSTCRGENRILTQIEKAKDETFDLIVAIGPLVMMKFVTLTAKPFGVPVTVSMNPIMVDGTGMCGGCRITLNQDGKKVAKFACVDGPDFNGYEVDFDEALSRGRIYFDFERRAHEGVCNLFKQQEGA